VPGAVAASFRQQERTKEAAMNIHATVATRHGATAEISGAIVEHLIAVGHDFDVREPDEVRDLESVVAAALRSAVYAGHWLKADRELCAWLGPELAARAVWLFSSGLVDDPPKPAEDGVDLAAALAATRAREHRIFAGRIDKHTLAFGRRAIVRALHAAVGDFRDWDAIADWGRSIDSQVRTPGA